MDYTYSVDDGQNTWQSCMVFYLNPVYYLVSGYRDSLILNVSIISRWRMGLYFWAVTLVLMLVGRKLFSRLKVHFADVL